MNIFEGARRIAKLIAALIVLGFSVAMILDDPLPVSVSYLINGAKKPYIRVDQCEVSDAIQTKESLTKSGASVLVSLCFRSDKFDIFAARKDGVPDIEIAEYFLNEWAISVPKGFVLDPIPANQIKPKLYDFISAFQIPETDEAYISRLDWLQRAKHSGITLLSMFASLAGFWVFVWTVGWIVRGFKGIPQGRDSRE